LSFNLENSKYLTDDIQRENYYQLFIDSKFNFL